MKAITAVCATGASVPAVVNGRVSRHRDGENAEIKMYLSKLKDLVPFMPKNRKLSKLEIIQHVIDYICDLQSELETHSAVSNFDAAAALNGQQQQAQQISTSNEHLSQFNHENSNNSSSSSNSSNSHYSNQLQQGNSQNNNRTSSSSPQQRQPLCVRPSPNTILSTTHSNPLTSVATAAAVSGQTHRIMINNSSTHSHTIADKSKDRSHC